MVETIIGQTLFISQPNSELLGRLSPENQRVNAKNTEKTSQIIV
jgi:hypothetical protein